MTGSLPLSFFFFFNDTATTEIYTLSLHDALPIFTQRIALGAAQRVGLVEHDEALARREVQRRERFADDDHPLVQIRMTEDRKSTRLNSSHLVISYAVFCLKKKNAPRLASSVRAT